MFKVGKAAYPTVDSDRTIGYQIQAYPNGKHLYWVNKFLHHQANRSENTSKQYAYRLCRFLNFLSEKNKTYLTATNNDLRNFITSINIKSDEKTVILNESALTESTIKAYLITLKRFYVFLSEQDKDFLIDLVENIKSKDKHSLLYGNVFDETTYEFLINPDGLTNKKSRNYERWYSQEQIEAILSAFNTERDKAIFSLTLDGLRIDEALSAYFSNYDAQNRTLQLTRSKGRTKTSPRMVALSERTVKFINSYLVNERDQVESKLLDEGKLISLNLFINLAKRNDSYGRGISYSSWYQILKRAALKAGLDPKRIRTHSGRSTKAQELFNLQAQYPGSLSDNQIKQIMGWKNIDSSNPYKNDLDRQTALNNFNILNKLEEGE